METLAITNEAALANDPRTAGKGRFARYAPVAARVVLGLVFFVFGLDGFFHFFPMPTDPLPEKVVAFSTGMTATGYLFQLAKGTEVVVGILLLANRFVPLALALLAPVVVNILAFHAFLAPAGLPLPLVLLVLQLFLVWTYRGVYRPMLAARAERS